MLFTRISYRNLLRRSRAIILIHPNIFTNFSFPLGINKRWRRIQTVPDLQWFHFMIVWKQYAFCTSNFDLSRASDTWYCPLWWCWAVVASHHSSRPDDHEGKQLILYSVIKRMFDLWSFPLPMGLSGHNPIVSRGASVIHGMVFGCACLVHRLNKFEHSPKSRFTTQI